MVLPEMLCTWTWGVTKAIRRDAVHISPHGFGYTPCPGLHHFASGLSLQQPLYVQGLVLCYDFPHSRHADIVGESCLAHT